MIDAFVSRFGGRERIRRAEELMMRWGDAGNFLSRPLAGDPIARITEIAASQNHVAADTIRYFAETSFVSVKR